MPGPLTASALLQAGIAGAAVVAFGGLYALFLAWYRMHGRAGYRALALLFYCALAMAFYVLARALALDMLWQAFIVLLLVAYLLAPLWIWRLTEATHAEPGDVNDRDVPDLKFNEETPR